MPEQEGGIRGNCACGAQVWHVQHPGQLPRPSETILCPNCGQDNSRQPSLAWLLKFYWARLKKRRRYFGLVRMWWASYPVPFWQFRGYPKSWLEARAAGQLPYQMHGRYGKADDTGNELVKGGSDEGGGNRARGQGEVLVPPL